MLENSETVLMSVSGKDGLNFTFPFFFLVLFFLRLTVITIICMQTLCEASGVRHGKVETLQQDKMLCYATSSFHGTGTGAANTKAVELTEQ